MHECEHEQADSEQDGNGARQPPYQEFEHAGRGIGVSSASRRHRD
jgi:hypothetical protein